jgi:DNA-binding MarR family transcriptional regulator
MTVSRRPFQPDRVEPSRFGDLLALARARWIARMGDGLDELGFPGYRRSDALVVRLLLRGSVSINGLAAVLGVSRQAARKIVDALEHRGYASEARDARDSRIVKVALTAEGERYAVAVLAVIERLDRELRAHVDATELAAATRVLRALSEFGR